MVQQDGETQERSMRVFLVVVDDSQEMNNALRYACRRASKSGGRVALLKVIEPVEFQHWLGVSKVMEHEARSEVERKMQATSGNVINLTGNLPAIYIREGQQSDQLLSVLDEDPTVSLLVLATAKDTNDPGPLVNTLITHMGRNKIRVPVTLVPGNISEEDIDALT